MENPPENSVILNVHVTPDDRVAAQYVEISQSLKSDGTMFVLDGISKFPHMTVFMARFSVDQIPNVIKALEDALKNTKGFACKHTGYFMTKEGILKRHMKRLLRL